MTEPFVHRFRVRYSECDQQGVVFNANYMAYLDDTTNELWRSTFGSYQAMLERGVDIVVAEVRMRFLGAARFEDELTVEAVIAHMGTTSMTLADRLLSDDGKLLLEAEIRYVWVQRDSVGKTPIPDWARSRLASRLAQTSADERV
ncbi:MAG: acyl-CoA thioesterase [Solirubrobacteraceae bacterium]